MTYNGSLLAQAESGRELPYGYHPFMRFEDPTASGGFGLLVPSDWAAICSAKLLRSYRLADFI